MPSIPPVCETEADLPEEQDGPHPILNLTALKVKLLLPSELDPSIRQQCCLSNLILTEMHLHFGVAEDSLSDLRKYLTVRKYLVNYKIKHVSGPGQKENTHAHAIIDRFKSKVNLSADKDKAACHALESLDPDGSLTLKIFSINWSHRFLVLTSQDMVFLNADPDKSDEEGSSSRGNRGGARKRKRKKKRQEERLEEGHRTFCFECRPDCQKPG